MKEQSSTVVSERRSRQQILDEPRDEEGETCKGKEGWRRRKEMGQNELCGSAKRGMLIYVAYSAEGGNRAEERKVHVGGKNQREIKK